MDLLLRPWVIALVTFSLQSQSVWPILHEGKKIYFDSWLQTFQSMIDWLYAEMTRQKDTAKETFSTHSTQEEEWAGKSHRERKRLQADTPSKTQSQLPAYSNQVAVLLARNSSVGNPAEVSTLHLPITFHSHHFWTYQPVGDFLIEP